MAITRTSGRGGTFVGRRSELEVLADLIADARQGRSGSAVLRAAAGLGKTFLLERVVDEYATGMRVVAISGIEAESVFDYAAVQRLCGQLPSHVDRIPTLQRRALGVAVGTESGDPPDPFMVGLAVVNLLRPVPSVRCCASSTTPSGSTTCPVRCWASRPDVCRPIASP